MENKRIMNDLAAMSSNSTTNPVAVDRVVSSSSKTTEISDGIVQCHRLNAAIAIADVRRQLSLDTDGSSSDGGIGGGGSSGGGWHC